MLFITDLILFIIKGDQIKLKILSWKDPLNLVQ
jgi:hypothetical protein